MVSYSSLEKLKKKKKKRKHWILRFSRKHKNGKYNSLRENLNFTRSKYPPEQTICEIKWRVKFPIETSIFILEFCGLALSTPKSCWDGTPGWKSELPKKKLSGSWPRRKFDRRVLKLRSSSRARFLIRGLSFDGFCTVVTKTSSFCVKTNILAEAQENCWHTSGDNVTRFAWNCR